MTYRLEFVAPALKEWEKLDSNTREQFRRKLKERLEEPHIASARLRGARDRYKIKLRSAGYRIVYEVHDDRVLVVVIAIGKRDRAEIYRIAERR